MSVRADAPISLESGDHLTRDEFHRRYDARPDIKKAELVQGVVYVASPVRFSHHAQQHGFMVAWLGAYVARTPGVLLGDNATVILDDQDEVQPDVCLWRPTPGGPELNGEGYIQGPPQLVVEIAASSVSYDLHEKKDAYQRSGVREYLVWRVLDAEIDWFRIRDGVYARLEPGIDTIARSVEFPGLHVHVPAMLSGDLHTVLSTVRHTS
jgi:Uma2 family endonuclease